MSVNDDRALIKDLGGPAQVAKLLGFEGRIGTCRVFNWTKRGIPSAVKVQFPKIFMRAKREKDTGHGVKD